MAQAFSHTGPASTIPATASPGLRFLAAFLHALDSDDHSDDHGDGAGSESTSGVGSRPRSPFAPFLAPHATFTINGGATTPAATVLAMMALRSARLKTFRHELKGAWDIEAGDAGSGISEGTGAAGGRKKGGRVKRTVLYESVSVTVFRDDVDEKAIEVAEFCVLELESAVGGRGEGVMGLNGVEEGEEAGDEEEEAGGESVVEEEEDGDGMKVGKGDREEIERGFEGLVAGVLTTFMDANPIMQRLKQIGGSF